MNTRKKISKEERKCYVMEYLSSPLSKHLFEKEKGLSYNSIRNWLRIFALEDKPKPIIMSKESSMTEQELSREINALRQEVKRLKAELKYSNMARDAYDHMIDLAEETYNIKVRKNSDAR